MAADTRSMSKVRHVCGHTCFYLFEGAEEGFFIWLKNLRCAFCPHCHKEQILTGKGRRFHSIVIQVTRPLNDHAVLMALERIANMEGALKVKFVNHKSVNESVRRLVYMQVLDEVCADSTVRILNEYDWVYRAYVHRYARSNRRRV